MISIVLELQRDALDKSVSISDLLRKALVVARKLRITQFEEWINSELNGYGYKKRDDIPEYRKIKGSVKAWNPYHGWQPIIFQDHEIEEALSTRPCVSSIAEIESLVLSKTDQSILQMPYPSETEQQIRKAIHDDTNITLVLPSTSMVRVVDAVRTIVLNWALKLEEDGILGEGMTFSSTEMATAEKTSYNINNFYGPVQSPLIQQSSPKSVQLSVHPNVDITAVTNIVKEIRENQKSLEITGEDEKELESELQTLEAQLSSPKPKHGMINEGLKTIRRIMESAGGGVAAQILIKLLQAIAS